MESSLYYVPSSGILLITDVFPGAAVATGRLCMCKLREMKRHGYVLELKVSGNEAMVLTRNSRERRWR